MPVLQVQNPSTPDCIWPAPPEHSVHGVVEGVTPPPIQPKRFMSMCLALQKGPAETGKRHQGNSRAVVPPAAQGDTCRGDP